MRCGKCGAEWRPRDQVGGWHLGERLARSGFAQIFVATNAEEGAPVVVKIFALPADCAAEDEQRFESDVRVLTASEHPHWVRVFGGGTEEDFAWLAMERLPGDSLAGCGKLSEQDALSVAWQIAEALVAARTSGLTHGNLQIGECLLDEARVVKVSGFAEAPFYRIAGRYVGAVWGRLSCTPPERIFDEMEDERSEIYELGAILFQLLAGELPYEGATMPEYFFERLDGPPLRLREAASDVRETTAALVERMMAIEPEGRFPSWEETAEALRHELETLSQTASAARVRPRAVAAVPLRSPVKAPVYSAKPGAWFSILMVAGLLGFAGWAGWKHFHESAPESVAASAVVAATPLPKATPAPKPKSEAPPPPAAMPAVPAAVVAKAPPPVAPKMNWIGWKRYQLEAPARPNTVKGGDHRIAGGGLRLSGNNTGIDGGHDENVFFARQMDGDWTLITRVSANSGPAGICAREGLASDQPCVGIFIGPDEKVKSVLRTATAGKVVPVPVAAPPGSTRWLKLIRKGGSISAFHSPDGKSWREAVTLNSPTLPPSVPAGFVVWSGALKRDGAATFEDVNLTPEK